MQSNNEVKIISNDGAYLEQITLSFYTFYHLKNIAKNEDYILYCEPLYDDSFKTYSLKQNTIVVGGKASFINYPIGNALVTLISYLTGIEFQVFDLFKTLEDIKFEYKLSYEDWFLSFSKQVNELYKMYLESDYDVSSLNHVFPKVYLINGIDRFKNSLSPTTQKRFFDAIEKANSFDKYHFIFMDTVDKIKGLEYESWYKSTVRSNQGIWICNGITEQFSLKINKVTKELYEEILPHFGYSVKGGNYKLIKLVEKSDKDE